MPWHVGSDTVLLRSTFIATERLELINCSLFARSDPIITVYCALFGDKSVRIATSLSHQTSSYMIRVVVHEKLDLVGSVVGEELGDFLELGQVETDGQPLTSGVNRAGHAVFTSIQVVPTLTYC